MPWAWTPRIDCGISAHPGGGSLITLHQPTVAWKGAEGCGIAARCLATSLAALQRVPDFSDRPVLAGRDDPDTAVVGRADEGMRGDVVEMRTSLRSASGCQLSVTPRSPGKMRHFVLSSVRRCGFPMRSDLQRLPRSRRRSLRQGAGRRSVPAVLVRNKDSSGAGTGCRGEPNTGFGPPIHDRIDKGPGLPDRFQP